MEPSGKRRVRSIVEAPPDLQAYSLCGSENLSGVFTWISREQPELKTRLQREIEAADRQIDQLVYELYGAAEEEIKIVEEGIWSWWAHKSLRSSLKSQPYGMIVQSVGMGEQR